MKKFIILLLMCFTALTIFSQEVVEQQKVELGAIIYLKSGTQIEVEIIEWDQSKGVRARTIWGQEMYFANDLIKKIKAFSGKARKNPYMFKDRGMYYSLAGGFISGNYGVRNNEVNGYTLNFASGYRFHRLLSVGIGTGLDQYAHKSGERIYPVYLDLRSFLSPQNTSFVLNLQVGYGLAFSNRNKGIIESQGGLYIYPNLGLSFGASETKYSFDVGYKFQNTTFTYGDPWEARRSTEYDLDFRRFVLRFGVTL